MSLSALMTALAEYVGDVLVNDCNMPIPDRVLRYHGTLPDDCCTDNGVLAVSWAEGRMSTDFPSSAAQAKNDPCAAKPVYTVSLRYRTCWPVPKASAAGIELIDAEWDAKAARLADTADCVARALALLTCDRWSIQNDPFVRAVFEQTAGLWLRFVDVAPSVPQGGCAGLLWRMYVAPLPGPVS